MTRSDMVLTISGLGCWIAFSFSLGTGSFGLFAVPTQAANAFLVLATLLALVSFVLLTRRLIKQQLLTLPIVSGLLGSTLLVTVLVLAIIRYA